MLPPATYTSNLPMPVPVVTPDEPLSEPSLGQAALLHSQPASKLNSKNRCCGNYWNLGCKIIPTNTKRCDSCAQGFFVNFNLLRIKIELDPYPYKYSTQISSNQLAIKFNNPEEAETQSKKDPQLKPYISPYGRIAKEIFFYCNSPCGKIVLKNPDPFFDKIRLGCCSWTLQKREKKRLFLKKRSGQTDSSSLSLEKAIQSSTAQATASSVFSFSLAQEALSIAPIASMNFSSSFSASSSSSNTVTPLPPQLFPSPSLPPSSLPFTPFHLRQPSSFNRELNPFLTSNLSSSSSSTSSNEPSFEPSLPHSQSAQLNSIGRCKGYFWNLDCKIISTRPQRCDSCYQGFTVNFNLLRIKIESDPYPYKNFTHISPTELAIKFNNTEEAESVSKFDPKLKPYVSPYGRMGEERFFYCAGKCNKIALNHPGISFPKNTPKSRVGCCLWTLQRRGKGRPLLIKQPDPRSSAPLSPEGGTNFSTPPPEAPPTLPHLPLYSSPLPSNFSSYSIPYSATEIPVVDHSDGPDEPDEPDDFDDLYASGLSSLIYPSLPINAKKAPLPIGSFPPSFLPPPSSSSNSPLSLPSNPSTQPPFSLPYNPSPFSFPTIPLALPSDSQYVSTGIHSEASNKKIPVVDHSEEPDQPDDFDDLYASKLSSLLYPSLPINAKKAPLPIGSLIPCFLPAPSSSSSSPLSPPRNASTQPPFSLPYNPSPFSFPTIQLDLPSFDSQSVSTTAIDLEASNLADPLSSNPSEPLPSALSPSRPPTPHPFSPVPLEIPAPVGDFDNLDCLDSLENLDGLDDYSFTTIPPAPFPSSPSNRSTPQSFNLFPPLSPLPFSSGASLNNTGDDISLTATSSFTNLKMTPMVDQATAIGQYLTIQLHMPEFTPLLILKDLKVEFAGVQINFEIMRTFIKIEIPRSYFSNEYLKFLRFRQIECEFPDTVVIRNAKELETQYKITLFSTDKTDPLFEKWLTLKNHLLENFQTE